MSARTRKPTTGTAGSRARRSSRYASWRAPSPARCRWALSRGQRARLPASQPACQPALSPRPGRPSRRLVSAQRPSSAPPSLCAAPGTLRALTAVCVLRPHQVYRRNTLEDTATQAPLPKPGDFITSSTKGLKVRGDPAIPPTPPHGSPRCRWRQWAPEGRSRAFGVHVCGRARARARPYAPLLYGNACTPPAPGAPYSTSPARRPTERADCHLPQHAQRLTSPGALSAADTPPRTASPVYQAAGLESDDNKLFARYVEVSKETHLYGKKGLFVWQKRPICMGRAGV